MAFRYSNIAIATIFWLLFILVPVALPALYNGPYVKVSNESVSIEVSWNHWSEAVDYGTGPVTSYNVHYERNGVDQIERASTSPVNLVDVAQGGTYTIWVGAVREIGGIEYEGSHGPDLTVRIPCGGKNCISYSKFQKL